MAANRRAEIRYKEAVAGYIEERPDGSTVFAYEPGWATSIGCALPAVPSIHTWRGGVHPFFQHLTAEGWLREGQARVSAIGPEDDLGLLLDYGRDCVGAVSVHRTNVAQPGPALPEGLDPAMGAALAAGRTISGVQKKILAVRREGSYVPAGPDGPAPFIAKFNSDDIPTLVRNEALTLRLARILLGKSEVTAGSLGQVDGLGAALLVERFDRTEAGDKLRLEDLCQVLGRPRRGSDHKYDSSYEEAGRAIEAHSARPQIDLLRFLKRVVADAALGNCDGHLKNFALLERSEGLRLAPAYDLVNTVLYHAQGYSTRFALRIDGDYRQHDRVDGRLLRTLAHNLDLGEHIVERAFAELKRGATRALAELRSLADAEREPGFVDSCEQVVVSAVARIFDNG